MKVNKTLDDVNITTERIGIIEKKYILKKIYEERYNFFKNNLSKIQDQKIIEIGSGAGFIKQIIPEVITSEIMNVPNMDMYFSAMDMPFEKDSISDFLMIDVLHHIPDVNKMLEEVNRCLKSGGRLIFTEPANTLWSRFIYQNFHHETFDPKAEWKFESKGPLSDANGALPFIVFERDREKFEKLFPNLKVIHFKKHSPLMYLISGGFTMKQLVPNSFYNVIRGIEKFLGPLNPLIGMFETVIIEKK